MKSTSFVVNWEAPARYNGLLKNYQLQWIQNNTYKTRIITGHLTQPMRATIGGLGEYIDRTLIKNVAVVMDVSSIPVEAISFIFH